MAVIAGVGALLMYQSGMLDALINPPEDELEESDLTDKRGWVGSSGHLTGHEGELKGGRKSGKDSQKGEASRAESPGCDGGALQSNPQWLRGKAVFGPTAGGVVGGREARLYI